MKVFELDDEGTLYLADSGEEAAKYYAEDSDEPLEHGYPRELSNEELDRPRLDIDEDERPTGRMSTVRTWLAEAKTKGLLACVC